MSKLEPYKGKCVVLFTSYVSNQLFEVHTPTIQNTRDSGKERGFTVAASCACSDCCRRGYPRAQVAWRKLETTFEGRSIKCEKVDGANDADVRRALWQLSGERKYPQVFVGDADSAHGLKFVGGMDEVQEVRGRPTNAACIPSSPAAQGV